MTTALNEKRTALMNSAIDTIMMMYYKDERRYVFEEVDEDDTNTFERFMDAAKDSIFYHLVSLNYEGVDYMIDRAFRFLYRNEYGEIDGYDTDEDEVIKIGKKQNQKWRDTFHKSIQRITDYIDESECKYCIDCYKDQMEYEDKKLTLNTFMEFVETHVWYYSVVLRYEGNEIDIKTHLKNTFIDCVVQDDEDDEDEDFDF